MTFLSEKDHGREIHVEPSSVITVRLEENPTTGYRWKVDSSAGLTLLGDYFSEKGEAIGAAGAHFFNFQLPRSGTHELRMMLLRGWEGEQSVIDRFTIKVSIKNKPTLT